MMTLEERAAWIAEIELCDNLDSLQKVWERLQELDREIGPWGPLCTQSIVDALLAQREKLQTPRWKVWEEPGMAVANMESVKKLEVTYASNAQEADIESYNIKEGCVLWTSNSSGR